MSRLALLVARVVREVRYCAGRSQCALCLAPSGCRRFCPPCLTASLEVSVAVDAARWAQREAQRDARREWGPGANPGTNPGPNGSA